MRLRGVLAIVMSIAGAVVTTPVRAVTVDLTYTGAIPGNPDFFAAGGGFFSAPDQPSIGLQDLTAFFFTWSVFGDGPSPSPPFVAGLPDLLSFSATVSGTTVTSLALSTRLVPNPGTFNPEFFTVTSLAQGGAWTGAEGDTPEDGALVGIVVVAVRVEGLPPVAVPGPIAGAGLPALLALGGFLWACRRKFVRGPMISL
jgi:hypothetical protein